MDVVVADTATGEVKTLIEERLNTYVESKPLRLVNNGTELIFWSERDGWGHFYLYDAATGALKNRITEGEFVATGIEGVDDKARVLYLSAGGREKGEDPYYTHLYRVGFDGTRPEAARPRRRLAQRVGHRIGEVLRRQRLARRTARPSRRSTTRSATRVLKLETPDLAPLTEAGFKFPEPFTVKADDGITDLYGVMYKPFDFDPAQKYPIIAFVYPGPQTESVTKTFNPRSNNISLAQFGFIVDRGRQPRRPPAALEVVPQLRLRQPARLRARRQEGGDRAAGAAPFVHRHQPRRHLGPLGRRLHVGGGDARLSRTSSRWRWSESGNHENNIYNNSWSEKHHGVKEVEKDGKVTFEYDIEKNSELAKNLKGHLMLITGDIDNNVHPANTYRLADALIKANKRFDMFVLPGVRHSFQPVAGYVNWLRGDYFARHLLGSVVRQRRHRRAQSREGADGREEEVTRTLPWPALVVLGTLVLSAQVQPQKPGAAERLVGAWQLVTRTVQANGTTLADPVLGEKPVMTRRSSIVFRSRETASQESTSRHARSFQRRMNAISLPSSSGTRES